MKFSNLKQDKGVAGLTIFLSLIVMLFVIGLLVMIFSLMGGELQDATYDTTAGAVVNESITTPTMAGITLAKASLRDGACGAITKVYNGTENTVISAGNYTQTGCVVVNKTSNTQWATTWKVSYPYTWSADNTATDVMNDTVAGISNSTDWFAIFIVIGAMVVLILLTVIIITAIRGSGLVAGGGESQGNNQNVGSA